MWKEDEWQVNHKLYRNIDCYSSGAMKWVVMTLLYRLYMEAHKIICKAFLWTSCTSRKLIWNPWTWILQRLITMIKKEKEKEKGWPYWISVPGVKEIEVKWNSSSNLKETHIPVCIFWSVLRSFREEIEFRLMNKPGIDRKQTPVNR